jgi:hypothetical protein
VVIPAGCNAATWLLDGADQLAGTDIGPSVPARARTAVTLPRPAPPPRLDAAPRSAAAGGGEKFGRGIPKSFSDARTPAEVASIK